MAFTLSHYTLQGYLLRRGCKLLSTPKLLLNPAKHDILHSKHISVEVIDQKNKLWAFLSKNSFQRESPEANISSLTVKLTQRKRKWPSRYIWKEHVFILLTLLRCVVETRCIVYRPTHWCTLCFKSNFLTLCSCIALKSTHEYIFPCKRLDINKMYNIPFIELLLLGMVILDIL